MTNQPKDLYEVLGVDRRADNREIREAYRRIALANHPDRFPDDAEKAERFREAALAYEILSNPRRRREYDQVSRIELGHGVSAAVVDYFRQVFVVK